MAITDVNVFIIKAGWRDWCFCRITNNEIVGWSEISDSNTCLNATIEVIKASKDLILGTEIDNYENTLNNIKYKFRQNLHLGCQKAIAGIENALVDLFAKSLGISVSRLLKGISPQEVPVYWSHFGTTRIRAFKECGLQQLKTLDDLKCLFNESISQGIFMVKSNICILDNFRPYVFMPGTGKGTQLHRSDQIEYTSSINAINDFIDISDEMSKKLKVAIDLNFNLPLHMHIKLSNKAAWYEFDLDSTEALNAIKMPSFHTRITGENILNLGEIAMLFQNPNIDIVSLDPCWLGIKKMINANCLSLINEKAISIHNFNSHMSTAIGYQSCQLVDKLHYLENDFDDVPWKDKLFTNKPKVENGRLSFDEQPGWGCDLNLEEANEYITKVY